jgi:SAM-dependent methyltransferase
MNLRPLAYGLLSYLPWVPESLYRGTGGSGSPEYCYCIWLRHLTLAHDLGMKQAPDTVAELGPGDSIGVGLAALLCGSGRYVALDAMRHANPMDDLRVFDELVALFERRAQIPGRDQFPEIALDLQDLRFPSHILDEGRMAAALHPDRVANLRAIVGGAQRDPSIVDYRAPWDALQSGDEDSVDFLLSNAVMEHVADLPGAYRAVARWLRPGGFASHQIDFRSHSLFSTWDGHWACPDALWMMFVGRRRYLLNREPFQTHRTLASSVGLAEVAAIRIECAPESKRLAQRFRTMGAQDRLTCGGYLLSRKLPS